MNHFRKIRKKKWRFRKKKWRFRKKKWPFRKKKWPFRKKKWPFRKKKWRFRKKKWPFRKKKWHTFKTLERLEHFNQILRAQLLVVLGGDLHDNLQVGPDAVRQHGLQAFHRVLHGERSEILNHPLPTKRAKSFIRKWRSTMKEWKEKYKVDL